MSFKPEIRINPIDIDHLEPDRIPGTDAHVTQLRGQSLYSQESDLDQISSFMKYHRVKSYM